MLLVLGGCLGAVMPAAGLVGQALERVQAAELRHADDPGRVVFRGQDGQHLLQGGDGVVVAAAQYRQVGEMPQRAALGQDIASPGEPVRGTAQQHLRPIVIGARERGDAPGQRSQPYAPVIRLGLQQRAGLLEQADGPLALAIDPGQCGAVQPHGERMRRPVAGHLAEFDRLLPVAQGIVAALRQRELLGEGQRSHPPRGGRLREGEARGHPSPAVLK